MSPRACAPRCPQCGRGSSCCSRRRRRRASASVGIWCGTRPSGRGRVSGWAHARPRRGCLYGATHSQQLVELAGAGRKQLQHAQHSQHGEILEHGAMSVWRGARECTSAGARFARPRRGAGRFIAAPWVWALYESRLGRDERTYTCRQLRLAHGLGCTERAAVGPEWLTMSMAPAEGSEVGHGSRSS